MTQRQQDLQEYNLYFEDENGVRYDPKVTRLIEGTTSDFMDSNGNTIKGRIEFGVNNLYFSRHFPTLTEGCVSSVLIVQVKDFV